MKKHTFEIGQTIVFKALTRHSYKKATRKINGSWHGSPTVRYHGWNDFIIKDHEIIEIY